MTKNTVSDYFPLQVKWYLNLHQDEGQEEDDGQREVD
jgi:hypothetical protein